MKSPITSSCTSCIATTQLPTNDFRTWSSFASSLKEEAQKLKDMSFEVACAARKCDVNPSAVPSRMNMKSCGMTVTDSRYKANAHAMSDGMKSLSFGCSISARTNDGTMRYKCFIVSLLGS